MHHKRNTYAICIFVLFFTLYLLAYSGLPHTTDETTMVAASQALSRHGRLTANPFIWNPYGVVIKVGPPWISTKVSFEPAQSTLGAALHLAADRFPRLGNVHAVLLLNVIVTALTVVLVFLYVRELDYTTATAMVTAVIYGTATIALPFAKTFFREPLSAFSLLLAAYGLLRLARRGQPAWSIAVILGLGLAATTKASNLFSLVAFVPIAPFYLRDYLRHERRRRRGPGSRAALVILSLVVALALLYAAIRGDVFARIARALQERLLLRPIWLDGKKTAALYGFLLSPGKSFFIYTPVFLACFVSLPWFWRERRREAILCSAMALAFLFGYVHTDAHTWWAGLGWGPRFLVPVAPFLSVTLAPLLSRLLKRPTAPAAWPFYILLAASLLVQAVGAAFSIEFYSDKIGEITPGGMWSIALYDIRYSAPIFLLRYIHPANFDFAWAHAWGGEAQIDWPVLLACAVVAVLAGAALWRCRERGWLLAAGGLALTVGLAFFALSRYYDDPRYLGGDDYHALADYLAQAAAPEDAIVVTNHIYTNFFLNYTKGRTEWYAERREFRPISRILHGLLDGALQEYPRLWLVVDNSPLPAHANLPKAAEAWTVQNAFKLDEKIFGDYCRVATFDGTHYPLPETPPRPLSARLGQQITLQGYYLPAGDEQTAPGGLVRLALYWQALRPVTEDYHVTVQLLDEQGALHWQTDRVPVEGFWPTSSWEPGQLVRDLYTLHLPPDLPPGKYRIIAAMYDWRSGERLPVSGQDVPADHATIATIQLTN